MATTKKRDAKLASPVLQPRSFREKIVETLQQEIVCGNFPPGFRLVERDLIDRFGVSSIPVREALQDLENRGLVTRKLNYGCSVIRLTPAEAASIAEFRRVLEPRVMEWAAMRITPKDQKDLERQLERFEKAVLSKDLPNFFHEDMQLHRKLWEIAGNIHAARALETAMGSLFAAGISKRKVDKEREITTHRELVTSVCSADPKAAGEALHLIATNFEKHVARMVASAEGHQYREEDEG